LEYLQKITFIDPIFTFRDRWKAAYRGEYPDFGFLGAGDVRLFSRILFRLHAKSPMAELSSKPAVTIRNLQSLDDLKQAEEVEREVWGLADLDTTPMTLAIATKEAGSFWVGAFDGAKLAGFAFGFLGMERGQLIVHSHMLAVREPYRNSRLGYRLKLAQRERALALRIDDGRNHDNRASEVRELRANELLTNGLRIKEMTWTFDPLQSRNAHLNFAKLGVVSETYKVDFYGPETSSVLHRNSTDRLWVTWPLTSRRVQERLLGKDSRAAMVDALSTLTPLIRFNGNSKPIRTDLAAATGRQRIAIEIPSDISDVERKDPALAREWRLQTRWAFTEALSAGFFVAEFCRTVRGQQGPGVYLLEKGKVEEYVPELRRRVEN
jgi:predicted GNAT superfamily acetyltransferase